MSIVQVRTCHRLSLLGGSSDYQEYYSKFGGIVVGAGIDKYSRLICRKLPQIFDYRTRLSYSKIETVKNNNDIEHNAIRHTIKYLGLENEALEIVHYSDLPSFSGTGSSSAFIVGLVNGLSYLSLNKKFRPLDIAKATYHIEHDLMGETVGQQDGCYCSQGGLRVFTFNQNGEVDTYELRLGLVDIEDFEKHILLLHVNTPRKASEIAKSFVPNLGKNSTVHELVKLADEAISVIENKGWSKLGKLLNRSWEIKRNLSDKVSNKEIDNLYQTISKFAYGAKIMGAGGGGTFIIVAPPEKHDKIISETNLVNIPFKFDFEGSVIQSDK